MGGFHIVTFAVGPFELLVVHGFCKQRVDFLFQDDKSIR